MRLTNNRALTTMATDLREFGSRVKRAVAFFSKDAGSVTVYFSTRSQAHIHEGFIIGVDAERGLSELSSPATGHRLDAHISQTEYISGPAYPRSGPQDVPGPIYLILQGSAENIADWEAYEPVFLAAAWDRHTAEALRTRYAKVAPTVALEFPAQWIYGRDATPTAP